ncbi:hypothetical protein RchiOBHm_Chr2g0150731 [Rosa chinensis]|uniref:Uncharacterized protein n=1 Tax=Rosa chinensis TaxID=74649 RepID=A0A2P6RZY5_ROSCH|nr:hypothetical protein RchiOBHm_Chr2g0150731 [Rosa chinensis]
MWNAIFGVHFSPEPRFRPLSSTGHISLHRPPIDLIPKEISFTLKSVKTS